MFLLKLCPSLAFSHDASALLVGLPLARRIQELLGDKALARRKLEPGVLRVAKHVQQDRKPIL